MLDDHWLLLFRVRMGNAVRALRPAPAGGRSLSLSCENLLINWKSTH
jgi:hypothetical protein